MVKQLICIILGYVGTMIIAWQSIPKRNGLTYSALFFVFIGAGGAIWITIDTNEASDKLINYNKLLLTKTIVNSGLSNKLAVSQSEIVKLIHEDIDKSKGNTVKLSKRVDELEGKKLISPEEAKSLKEEIKNVNVSLTGMGSQSNIGALKMTLNPPSVTSTSNETLPAAPMKIAPKSQEVPLTGIGAHGGSNP